MLHTYLVVTTEGSYIVKAESPLSAATIALQYHDDPMSVRAISVQDTESLPEITKI